MKSPFVNALLLQRHFKASRDSVFKAWKDPELLKLWLGGQKLKKITAIVDFRVGGEYHLDVQAPSGELFKLHGSYQEIIEPSRIVFTWLIGNDLQEMTLVTVDLKEADGQTEMTLKHERFRDVPSRDMHQAGWENCFLRLDKLFMDQHE